MRWPWKRKPALEPAPEWHPVDVAAENLPPDPGWHALTVGERAEMVRARLHLTESDGFEHELRVLEADAARPSLSPDEYAAIVGPVLREIDMTRRRRRVLLDLLDSLA